MYRPTAVTVLRRALNVIVLVSSMTLVLKTFIVATYFLLN